MAELNRGGLVAKVTTWLLQGRVIYPAECATELGTSLRNFYKVLGDIQAARLPVINHAGRWYIPADERNTMGVLGRKNSDNGQR